MINELRKYAEAEGCELGEACTLLIQLYGYRDYLGSEFNKQLEEELKSQLDNFRTYSIITEEEIVQKYTIKTLEWL